MTTAFETSALNNFLPDYYKSIFPFKPYTKWLCYGKKANEYFNRREFAFILEGDVHLRYRSFGEACEFEKELCKVSPHKLDVGAVYNYTPRDNRSRQDFKAIERELVFDIDLTDYDVVRTCCSEAKVCSKCWKFIVAAVITLDRALRDDFAFQARMWVFSGRRGVHCWVGDEKARKLNHAGRTAVAEYLSLVIGDKLGFSIAPKLKGQPKPLHPSVSNAYRTLMDDGFMDEMVMEQEWLDGDVTNILAKINDKSFRDRIARDFEGLSAKQRWKYLKLQFDSVARENAVEEGCKLPELPPLFDRFFLEWFVLWHCYPRLDVNVSTGVNHLLKSPFCIHPKTGNVAVPLDVETIKDFNLNSCPRIDLLIKELAEELQNEDVKENRKLLGYKHTSLAPYVENFEKFVHLATNTK
ncbi:unnamed protein product [Auanema sp. JU1783]|nr:unnamed protein product [Auanema sp. JU1783]